MLVVKNWLAKFNAFPTPAIILQARPNKFPFKVSHNMAPKKETNMLTIANTLADGRRLASHWLCHGNVTLYIPSYCTPGRHANSSHMFRSYLCTDTQCFNGAVYYNRDHGYIKKTLPLWRNRGYAYHQVPSVRERHSGVAVRVWEPLDYKSNLWIWK